MSAPPGRPERAGTADLPADLPADVPAVLPAEVPAVLPADLPADVAANLDDVRSRIVDAGGDPASVRIVAVTKGFGVDAARAALSVGLADLGENYADELVAKAEAIASDPAGAAGVRWHFHGTLQTNKINRLAPHVHLWQTVDSPSRAAALASRVPGARVLVQVDFSGRPGRAGCDPAATDGLVRQARDAGLDVRGLMCVAPLGEPPDRAFAALRRLADGLDLAERSMGMSGDFEEAVRAGATMIRLGSVLFGPRPGRPSPSTA